jgi:hypothetical protein
MSARVSARAHAMQSQTHKLQEEGQGDSLLHLSDTKGQGTTLSVKMHVK